MAAAADPIRALEIEVEGAWVLLTTRRRPTEVRLTKTGRIVGINRSTWSADGEVVGVYTRAVSLMDFRDDVFHVFEEMHRG